MGYTGTTDAGISSWEPDSNAGNSGEMIVRTGDQKSALVRFDVSAIPAQAQILEANLQLYVTSGSREATLRAYRVLRSWDESQVTWRSARSGELWGSPGCNAIGIDREGEPTTESILGITGTWAELQITDLVASWVENPHANYGLFLKTVSAISTEHRLASSEHWQADWRPKLTIVYGIPATP